MPKQITSSTGIQLLIGLGNPGPSYTHTRHNAGAWFIQALCRTNNLTLKQANTLKAQVVKLNLGEQSCYLAIPTTYMNHSGQSVLALAQYYQIPAHAILVIHDELDLPVGTARLKTGGGHGGHNGLRDILHYLGTPDFHRLRIGIGRPHVPEAVVADYVLQSPTKIEAKQIQQSIDEALQVLTDILKGDIQTAMNQLHRGASNHGI